MPDDGRSRLGAGSPRSSAMSARRPRRVERAARPAPRADRIPHAQSAQPAAQFFRRRARRAGGLGARARRHPADRGARRCAARRTPFEIIAGERRWRAAQRAGLHDVPIVSIEASDDEALELAIIENVQRTDLNPLEEAAGYAARSRTSSTTARKRSPRSSARAAATSPIRCGS